MVPRQITRRVPYTRCRLVPQTVCGAAYSSCSECQNTAIPHESAKPLEPHAEPQMDDRT